MPPSANADTKKSIACTKICELQTAKPAVDFLTKPIAALLLPQRSCRNHHEHGEFTDHKRHGRTTMYDDMNRPLGSDPMQTQESSPWGGLIALAAIFVLLFVGIYFFSPPSGTHTAQNNPSASVPTAPAPSSSPPMR